jgi:anti-sigma regulatory factor (Ser/Thr protein kinase)
MTAAAADLRASIDLPATTRSVPAVRHIATQLLTAWSAESRCTDAVLLLSELVTNVLRHVVADPTLKVELLLSGPVLRVAVLDSSPTPPTLHSDAGPGGHGMRLVSTIANRWGCDRRDDGKSVWFELTDRHR